MVENVERHLHERQAAAPGGDRRRARAGRADHRDDDHAGRGLRAGRHPGRPDRRAVPRVRVHAGRRGHRVGRRRADAVADDGLASCCAPATPSAASPAGSTAASTACAARYTRALARDAARTGRSCSTLWVIVALLIVPFYMFSQQELAPAEDQGVVFSASSRPRRTRRSTRRSCSRRRSTTSTSRSRRAASIFQITFPSGGFGGMVTKPWSERTQDDAAAADGVDGAAVEDPRHPRDPA